jgi:hypothetical protein
MIPYKGDFFCVKSGAISVLGIIFPDSELFHFATAAVHPGMKFWSCDEFWKGVLNLGHLFALTRKNI